MFFTSTYSLCKVIGFTEFLLSFFYIFNLGEQGVKFQASVRLGEKSTFNNKKRFPFSSSSLTLQETQSKEYTPSSVHFSNISLFKEMLSEILWKTSN